VSNSVGPGSPQGVQSVPSFERSKRFADANASAYHEPRQARDRVGLADSVYEPVCDGLERVKRRLHSLCENQSPFLAELLDHVLETKGKRVRPAITLLCSQFHPNDGKKAETMAAAVELLHIATLIHDDTVDNSDIRRGKVTVSKMWGRNAAVLLGDYVFATSATFVCDTENVRVIRRFSETIMELSSGELHEMVATYDWAQTREQYEKRIYNKTASLFTTASESGAVLSGAPESVVDALRHYGYSLGMAFQIIDDILDFEGNPDEIGKPVGNDLSQGIMTLPAIMYIERNSVDNPLVDYFKNPEDSESLKKAVAAIQSSSVMRDSYAVAEQYCDSALANLAALDNIPALASLKELVNYVVQRRS